MRRLGRWLITDNMTFSPLSFVVSYIIAQAIVELAKWAL